MRRGKFLKSSPERTFHLEGIYTSSSFPSGYHCTVGGCSQLLSPLPAFQNPILDRKTTMVLKSLFLAGVAALAITTSTSALPLNLSEDIVTRQPVNATFATVATRAASSSRGPPNYMPVEFGCKLPDCTTAKTRYYDFNKPIPTHSCPRDAIAALGHWRLLCDLNNRALTPFECATRAPSIERCCGQWVKKNDEKYKNYPTARGTKVKVETGPNQDAWRWPLKEDGDKREIIKPGWDEYNSNDALCVKWRTQNEQQFSYFMQNLYIFGMQDVDETGKVKDSEVDRWDAEGVGSIYDDVPDSSYHPHLPSVSSWPFARSPSPNSPIPLLRSFT